MAEFLIDFPTLGDLIDQWVRQHCKVPDGFARGKAYEYADWQFWIVANHYRVRKDAKWVPARPLRNQAFHYRRSLIVGAQKLGKGPLAATIVANEAVGPSLFAGWAKKGDTYECSDHGCPCGWYYEYEKGEPKGMRQPSPLIQLTAFSEDQVDNTYRPLRAMVALGPLKELLLVREGFMRIVGQNDDPELDRIDAVTSSANSRVGNPISFALQDETGLWTTANKMRRVADAQRRGAAGMGGRTLEPLALDTPVPTPSGWSTVGDLRPGDLVYGSDGRAVEVQFATPVYDDRRCYRVTFDDGEQIVASDTHGWTVQRKHKKKPRVDQVTMTTEELAANLGRFNLSVPLVAVEGAKQDLPVHPYFLGLWLGDGQSNDASLCCSHAVAEELVALIEPTLDAHEHLVVTKTFADSVRLRPRQRHRICRWGHDWSNDEMGNGTQNGHRSVTCGACQRGEPRRATPTMTMRERLRAIGVLGDKHIPELYLASSIEQRMELLRGLMDSDGTVRAEGTATFVNTNERLARHAAELLVSLGYKVHVRRYDYPARGLPAFHVSFTPTIAEPVTKLAAKTERHRTTRGAGAARRYIRSVELVPSVPTRCIGIDTADHLFVVGRHNTLTHNTTNAWDPAEESVAQTTYEAAAEDVFKFYRNPDLALRDGQGRPLRYRNKAHRRRIHEYVYDGSWWVDLDSIEAEAAELMERDPAQAERFFGNRIVHGAGAWLKPGLWDGAYAGV